ncbi:MAG: hypothetical protein PHF11_07575, partial [Candidatus Omnitrophica bacterium]|nr:hypothetical protein [Candidatus Omnitrophota bacterium]
VTKEALDRIERKFTQIEIDRFILEELKRHDKNKEAAKFIREFDLYIQNKESDGLSLKFEGAKLKPEYRFLVLKLNAVEKAITKELGKAALLKIKDAYEQEMTRRILQERQVKT